MATARRIAPSVRPVQPRRCAPQGWVGDGAIDEAEGQLQGLIRTARPAQGEDGDGVMLRDVPAG
jgi:hypothetical protein